MIVIFEGMFSSCLLLCEDHNWRVTGLSAAVVIAGFLFLFVPVEMTPDHNGDNISCIQAKLFITKVMICEV